MDHKQWRTEFDDLTARMAKRDKRMIRFNTLMIVFNATLLAFAVIVTIIYAATPK
jgi:hypothetical protein